MATSHVVEALIDGGWPEIRIGESDQMEDWIRAIRVAVGGNPVDSTYAEPRSRLGLVGDMREEAS